MKNFVSEKFVLDMSPRTLEIKMPRLNNFPLGGIAIDLISCRDQNNASMTSFELKFDLEIVKIAL